MAKTVPDIIYEIESRGSSHKPRGSSTHASGGYFGGIGRRIYESGECVAVKWNEATLGGIIKNYSYIGIKRRYNVRLPSRGGITVQIMEEDITPSSAV